jgi:hypothetical protein
MKSRVVFLFLLTIPAARVEAQKIVDIAVGISPPAGYTLSHSQTPIRERVRSYIPSDSPNPGPYVIFGALVGAAAAGLWEAHAVSRNGDDMAGTGGLLWIPPVAGALAGGIGGWLLFKIVHSNPTPD